MLSMTYWIKPSWRKTRTIDESSDTTQTPNTLFTSLFVPLCTFSSYKTFQRLKLNRYNIKYTCIDTKYHIIYYNYDNNNNDTRKIHTQFRF